MRGNNAVAMTLQMYERLGDSGWACRKDADANIAGCEYSYLRRHLTYLLPTLACSKRGRILAAQSAAARECEQLQVASDCSQLALVDWPCKREQAVCRDAAASGEPAVCLRVATSREVNGKSCDCCLLYACSILSELSVVGFGVAK
jgi:hypothetical protein